MSGYEGIATPDGGLFAQNTDSYEGIATPDGGLFPNQEAAAKTPAATEADQRTRAAAQLRSMLGREPTQDELASAMTQGGPSNLTAGDIARQAPQATAELIGSGFTGALFGVGAAGRYAYNMLAGEGHEKSKELAEQTLSHIYQPNSDVGQGVLNTVAQTTVQAPQQAYQAAAYNLARAANGLGLQADPQASADIAGKEAEGATLAAPLLAPLEGAAAIARNPAGALALTRRALSSITRGFEFKDPEAALDAQGLLDQHAAQSAQSQGASAAAPQLAGASPELQSEIAGAVKDGKINTDAASKQLQADSLGIKYTEGEATGDTSKIVDERNNPELDKHRSDTNEKLRTALEDTREEVAPDVHTSNDRGRAQFEHGQGTIEDLEALHEQRRTAIKNAYDDVEKLNAGDSPVDGPQWVQNAEAQLKQEGRARFVPSEVSGLLEEFRDGTTQMTMRDFDNARTILAEQARKADRAGDGTAARAISIIRDNLEALPMRDDVTAAAKAAADKARGLARQDFQDQKNVPAYGAVVKGKAVPDNFTQKYVINGHADDVAGLKQLLSGNDVAQQRLSAATIDHLVAKGTNNAGALRNESFNNALTKLGPKLNLLLDKAAQEKLSNIGEALKTTQGVPVGSSVSLSRTAPALIKAAAGKGVTGVLKYGAHLIPGVGSKLADVISNVSGQMDLKSAAAQAVRPGAGIRSMPKGPVSPATQAMLTSMRNKAVEEAGIGAALRRTMHASHAAPALSKQVQK
jgi:hypothetical protein